MELNEPSHTGLQNFKAYVAIVVIGHRVIIICCYLLILFFIVRAIKISLICDRGI